MKRTCLLLLVATCLLGGAAVAAPLEVDQVAAQAAAEPLDRLAQDVEHLHPVAMMVLAKRLFDAGRLDEADFWYYEAKLRWLSHLRAHPELQGPFGEADRYQVFDADISPDIDWCASADVPNHAKIQQRVLDWDASHPDAFTPAGDPAKTKGRDSLQGLMASESAEAAAIKHAHDEKRRDCPLDARRGGGDPYAGSGGAMFGTPPQMVPPYDASRFASFVPGVTEKADVVKALGPPEMWFTDPDGTSGLTYSFHRALMPGLGMSQRVTVSFRFGANKVLTAIELPKDGP